MDIGASSFLVDIDVDNVISSTIIEVKRLIIYETVSKNVTLNGTEKIRSINLHVIIHRKYVRRSRE